MSRFLLFCLLLVTLAGCRQSAQPESNPNVTLALTANPLTVGETVLTITLTDAAGAPLAARSLDVRGDMTHPGMAPVLAEGVEADSSGTTRIPFHWTMSGDWQVTVTATLNDGTTAAKTFDLRVSD